MRHLISIITIWIATTYIVAQTPVTYISEPIPQPLVITDFTLGYEHSQTQGSNFNTSMLFGYEGPRWVHATLGFRVSTINMYTFAARGDFRWWLGEKKRSCLTLRNQYIYSIYAADRMQDLNMALTVAYDHRYFYVGIGGYAHMFHPFGNGEGMKSLWEPGLTYDLAARIFPKPHIWNLELQITNMRDFNIERAYAPNILLNGNYRIGGYDNEHLNLKLSAGFQPAGITHITANYYSFYFNATISCVL